MKVLLTIISIILALVLFFGLLYFKGKQLVDYRNGIELYNWQQRFMFPFNPDKPIVYIPEYFVGVYFDDKVHPNTHDAEERLGIIMTLSRNYNPILKISNLTERLNWRNSIVITNYCRYIKENDIPICFVAGKVPPSSVMDKIEFNNGKYWLAVYNHQKYIGGNDNEES